MSAPLRPVAHLAVVVLLGTVLAACSGGEVARPPGGTPGASEPDAPVATPVVDPGAVPSADPITVDLGDRRRSVTLDNGWQVQRCEGDAPLLCVRDPGGVTLGVVEFGSYPLDDILATALADGTVLAALEARVAEQHAAIAADRAAGCGAAYAYRAEPARRAAVGAAPAVVLGFSGVVDGREVERHRAWYSVDAGHLWVVTAAASDPAGCMATDLVEFTPAELAAFEPYLVRIVAGTPLPD